MRPTARDGLRAVAASFAFLTVIPIGQRVRLEGEDVARAATIFPMTGALLGAFTGLINWQLGTVAPALLTGSVVAVIALGLTGALHLDGLADFADGFGGRTVEERLRIMRDSRIGTYGACCLGLDIAVRVAAYAAVAGRGEGVAIAIAAGALSRGVGPPLAAFNAYVQAPGGVGSTLRQMGGPLTVSTSTAMASAIAIAALNSNAAIAIPVAVLAAALIGTSSRRRLGGITGDTVGAAVEVSELALLVVLACLL